MCVIYIGFICLIFTSQRVLYFCKVLLYSCTLPFHTRNLHAFYLVDTSGSECYNPGLLSVPSIMYRSQPKVVYNRRQSESVAISKNFCQDSKTYQSGRSPKVVALFSATNCSSYIIKLLQLHDKIQIKWNYAWIHYNIAIRSHLMM